ncbi:MAG TPA: mitofilin family membrane protein, partial [Xanthobacteraceae bacterium]|nr:mitofilin family membrane protein [Xanthobacteraceae bacterium]
GAVGGGVVGALVVIAVMAGLWVAGYGPSQQPPAATSAPAPDSQATADISARLKQIEGAIQALQQAHQPDQTLGPRIAAADAATKAQADSLAALTRRVDDVAASAQTALAQAKAATTAASSAADAAKNANQNSVSPSDIEALTGRVAALESTMKSLSDTMARPTSSADDGAARLTIASEALRAAVERGAPFQAELTAVKSLGVDQNAAAPLEPFAAAGVPRTGALAQELTALIPALQQAAGPASTDGSFVGRLESHAQALVRITPVNAPAGDDAASIVTRINVDAAHADIAAALADIAKLSPAAQSLAAAWVQKAQTRDAAVAAARHIAADALTALGKPASQ